MNPSPERRVPRFSRAERWVHWTVAILVVALIVSGACLYFPFLSGVVGNRNVFKWLHTAAGFLLPLPIVLALMSAAFRADLGRLNRFTPQDWVWFRRSRRSDVEPAVGKFNAGQKLAAAVTAGALIVLFGTGLVMYFGGVFDDGLQTGATFVHDWVSLAVSVLLGFHIAKGLADVDALRGMTGGDVPAAWAQTHHARWAAEMSADGGDGPAQELVLRSSDERDRPPGTDAP